MRQLARIKMPFSCSLNQQHSCVSSFAASALFGCFLQSKLKFAAALQGNDTEDVHDYILLGAYNPALD
jgi:hypothetical protein